MSRVTEHRSRDRPTAPAACVLVLLCAMLWLLSATTPALAQFTRFQNYTDEQGLDNQDITSIAQDPTGYMLFATQGGLYRFDGNSFRAYNDSAGLPPSWIRQVAIDPLGRTWAVTRDGVSVEQDGRFERLGNGHLFGSMEAPHLLAFGRNRVVVNDGGTLRTAVLDDRRIGPFGAFVDDATLARLPAMRPSGFVVAVGDDDFMFGCGDTVCRSAAGRFSVLDRGSELPAETWETALLTSDGTLWLRSLHHLAWRTRTGDQFEVVDIPGRNGSAYAGDPETLSLVADAQGRIYTQGQDGVLVWENKGWRPMRSHAGGLPPNPIQTLLLDREGSLWAGSNGAGAFRSIGLGRWEHWTTEDGLAGNVVWSVTRLPNDQLWTATYSGTSFLGARSTAFPGLNCALARTHDGRLWMAPFGLALVRLDPARGTTERLPSVGTVRTAMVDADNRLWLSTREGLVLIADAGAPIARIRPETVLAQGTRQTVASPSGEIWTAAQDGLFRMGRDGRFRPVVGRTVVPAMIDGLAFAPDGSLWASADGAGIERLRVEGDRVTRLRPLRLPELSALDVMSIYRDRHDRMWVGTDHGLDVLENGVWHHIDSTIGPIANDMDADGTFEDADGSLWFSTTRGLSHFLDPSVAPATAVLHATVTGISLDGRSVAPAPSLEVGSGAGSLSVRFTDLDYAQGRGIAFRYRLDGVDRGWNETTAHEVRYANLPEGTLRFTLLAIDTTHGSVSRPVGFRIHVRARWWHTPWFFAVCAALVGLAFVVLWQLRIRLLLRQQRRLTADRERLETLVRVRTAEIEQARFELQRLALSDALTGLPNRRAIMLTLEEAVARARRDGRHLAVLLCDIDHFKTINDRWGHQAGDEVLAAFGARLAIAAATASAGENAGRYGGEEFLVILDGEAAATERLGRGIVDAVIGEPFRFGTVVRRVTASGGLATLRHGDTTATLIARADMALYRAKADGRNRLRLEHDEMRQMAAPG